MSLLQNKKFIVVAGKGGVGRTTVTFVLGRLTARLGKKTLICLAHSGSRYRHLFGGREMRGIQRLDANLFLLNVDPVAAREEYALKIMRNRLLHRLVFSNRYVNGFLDAVPGLSEWAMLGKATWHVLPDAPPNERYDVVIFDSPPTGHGLDILRLPSAIVSSVQGGRMYQDAQQRVELLRDHRATAIVPVCLPEELPANETIELCSELQQQGLPVSAIVVNKLLGTLSQGAAEFCDSQCPQMNRFKEAPFAKPTLIRRERREEQQKHVERLAEAILAPMMYLPKLDCANVSESELNRLADVLLEQLQRQGLM